KSIHVWKYLSYKPYIPDIKIHKIAIFPRNCCPSMKQNTPKIDTSSKFMELLMSISHASDSVFWLENPDGVLSNRQEATEKINKHCGNNSNIY
ncbi:2_t:CDS:2, partial [Funneliformis caledonium]